MQDWIEVERNVDRAPVQVLAPKNAANGEAACPVFRVHYVILRMANGAERRTTA
jgi:hypothetical protein